MKQLLRFLLVFGFALSFCSCDHISFKKKPKQQLNDTIDTSQVDTFPSFPACKSIIDKKEKETCFRTTIHQEISKHLSQEKIQVRRPVNETIEVIITIHSNKKIELKSLKASEDLLAQIPQIESVIKESIQSLPEVFPAIKRDIPVTSEYKLPILISLKE